MLVLGIDPSLRATGYGLIDFQRPHIKLIETGTIEPKTKDLIQHRIHSIHCSLHNIIEEFGPTVMVVEKLYAHYNHPITASLLGHVRGVICLLCAQKNIQLVEESPKRIRKALTGNGNASKQQIRRFIAYTLQIDERQLTLDASDALALALGYIQSHNRRI